MYQPSLRVMIMLLVLHCMPGCLSSEKSSPGLHVRNITSNEQPIPAIILGGGIAGLTAALYMAQANIPCVVIEGSKPGGALAQSHSVRNWPGKTDVPGSQIVSEIREQVIANKVPILTQEVIGVDFSSWPYSIKTKQLIDGQVIVHKVLSCIIAMGAEPNFLGIPGETGDYGYWGRGVSNCAVCEGSLYKDKTVVVVGGGDAAIVEAGYLANIAKEVHVLIRKDVFRTKDIQARDRALNKSNVKVQFNTQAKEILGDGNKVTQVVVENNKTHERKVLDVDGFFLAIGSQPKTSVFRNQLELEQRGFIALKDHQATSKPGVFAAGDVSDPLFVQAITSAGQGCMAALQAKKFLEDVGFEVAFQIQNEPILNAQKEAHVAELVPETREPDQEGEGKNGRVHEPKDLREFVRLTHREQLPSVIDLYSTWCMPCKRMAPIFDDLAKLYKDRVNFIKINVSTSVPSAGSLVKMLHGNEVRAVPTFLFVRDGREVGRIGGMCTREELRRGIDELLLKKK